MPERFLKKVIQFLRYLCNTGIFPFKIYFLFIYCTLFIANTLLHGVYSLKWIKKIIVNENLATKNLVKTVPPKFQVRKRFNFYNTCFSVYQFVQLWPYGMRTYCCAVFSSRSTKTRQISTLQIITNFHVIKTKVISPINWLGKTNQVYYYTHNLEMVSVFTQNIWSSWVTFKNVLYMYAHFREVSTQSSNVFFLDFYNFPSKLCDGITSGLKLEMKTSGQIRKWIWFHHLLRISLTTLFRTFTFPLSARIG